MENNRHPMKTIAGLTFCSLAGIHLLNRSVDNSACVNNLIAREEGFWYSSVLGKVFYQVTGNGEEPILLIHDAKPFSSSYEWSRMRSRRF